MKVVLDYINKNINYAALFFLPILVLAIGNWYVASSHVFWVYDRMVYHDMTTQIILWHNSTLERFLAVYTSVLSQEYNNFFTLFLYPFINPFPFSRHLFISSVLLIFFIPAILILRVFLKSILHIKSNILLVYIIFLAIIFMPFLNPTLSGWIDIFGYIPLLLFYIMYFKLPIEERNYKTIILMSFLFYMPFLIRRIYIYEMITFTVFVIIWAAFDIIYNKKFNKTYIKNWILKHFVFGLGVIVFVLIFQSKLIIHVIFTSYSALYSSYQYNLYYEHFLNLYKQIGKYFLGMAIVGSILGIFSPYRKITIFFTFSVSATFFLFNLTQYMDNQHILDTIALGIFVLNVIAILCVSHYIKFPVLKALFLAVVLIVNIFAFLSSMTIRHSKFSKYLIDNKVISNSNVNPIVDPNFDEKLSLINKINSFVPDNENFMVLTHGGRILQTYFMSYSFYNLHTYDTRAVWGSIQDLRDLIKDAFFKTKYIIMESTGQSEFNKEQKVVSIPFKEITQYRNNVGKAFRKTDFKFITKDGVEIWIYEKTRPFTKQEIQDFLNEFYEFYPQWKELYNNRIEEFYNMQGNNK
ncbi:MAG: hypothetical protein FWE18_02985 [Alphaproteobacteria bacterium]|nr:hypothetical protein [Alphaproteobacteria bacterium]